MRSYPPLATLTPTRIYTITRRDGVVKRATAWTQPIIISGDTWTPAPGLKAFPVTEHNNGTPASTELHISAVAGGLITAQDIADGLYNDAELEIDIVEGDNPGTKYFDFYGRIGNVSKPLHGVAIIEARNPHAFPKFDLVPSFTVMCRFAFGGVFCGIPIWAPDREIARSTTYAVGDFGWQLQTAPNDYGDVHFEVTAITTGITASSAPSFDYTVGNTTTDGGVTWTARNGFNRACEIDTVRNRHNLTLTSSADPRDVDGWYSPGKIYFFSGRNKGRAFRIGAWRQSDLQLTTYLPAGLLAASGDKAVIWPDCDKTPTMCGGKYSNKRRYGGFDKFEGAKAVNLDA